MSALPPEELVEAVTGELAAVLHRAEIALAKLEGVAQLVEHEVPLVQAATQEEFSAAILYAGGALPPAAAASRSNGLAHAGAAELAAHAAALEDARAQIGRARSEPLSFGHVDEIARRLAPSVDGGQPSAERVRRTTERPVDRRARGAAPPAPAALARHRADLEQFLASSVSLPPLIRVAVAMAQLEVVQPYASGNARVARLLAIALMERWRLLSQPILRLSVFFLRHREEVARRLEGVRVAREWVPWVSLFLEAVTAQAESSVASLARATARIARARAALHASDAGASVLRLFEALRAHPIVDARKVCELLDVSMPAAHRAIDALVQTGVLQPLGEQRRDRRWIAMDWQAW